MPVYKGKTLKEAISKATGRSSRKQGVQATSSRECQRIAQQAQRLESDLVAFQRSYHSYLNDIKRLQGEMREVMFGLVINAIEIGIPITRIRRLLGVYRSMRRIVQSGQRSDQIELALSMVIEVIGIVGAIRNALRLPQIPREMESFRREADALMRHIERHRNDLESLRDRLESDGCLSEEPNHFVS